MNLDILVKFTDSAFVLQDYESDSDTSPDLQSSETSKFFEALYSAYK